MKRPYDWPRSEADLARAVVTWLTMAGWDVYEEVQPFQNGKRADIVAIHRGFTAVIECKTSFGLGVIDQAYGWSGFAHLVYVAVPWSRSGGLGKKLCEHEGIGIVEVAGHAGTEYPDWKRNDYSKAYIYTETSTRIVLPARYARRCNDVLRNVACDLHKVSAPAGSQAGGHVTPYRITTDAIRCHVHANPGATLKTIIESIPHHYGSDASARGAIGADLRFNRIEGVEARVERGKTRVYPVGDPPPKRVRDYIRDLGDNTVRYRSEELRFDQGDAA